MTPAGAAARAAGSIPPQSGVGFEEEPATEAVPRPPALAAQATTADPLDLVDDWALDAAAGALDGEDEDVDTMVQQLRGEGSGSTQVLADDDVVRVSTEEVSRPLSYSATEMLDDDLLGGGALQAQDTNEQDTVLRHRLPSGGGLEGKPTELARPPRSAAKSTLRDAERTHALAAEDLQEDAGEEDELMYARTALFDSEPHDVETVNRTGPPRRPLADATGGNAPAAGLATVHLPPRSSVPEDRPEAPRRGAPTPRPRDQEPRRGLPRWLLFVLASLLILAAAGAAGYYTRLRRQEQQRKLEPAPTAPDDKPSGAPAPPPSAPAP